MEVNIKVFGTDPPCPRCKATEKLALEVAKEFEGKALIKVQHLSVLSKEAEKYDIISTPTVVINDVKVFSGRVPTKEEFVEAVQRLLK